ncbi:MULTISPECIES: glutamate--tRNA ligase [Sphingomonas]|jgi:glutamyl-tRNA synthetase|uniref:Glutamate--tRNA ligase n=1 Tax=Sphingomonas zeae TaxID=1646122 RepID=A0A7Y6EH68_9SPHN|nr:MULTISPECIES: glutamate--tRNA ligase [Sphingomonas]MBB4048971.1 glutamyl-tRNA synthetase [Sphingomonas zeae]MDK8185886.1 glutamate--tRNA ligase [Sphingomonas zeae]MDK8215194.1 glutamate--tRNA ligase [Sphingomonas sp. UMB7805-LC452B]NUU47195.1 glutamate--tRNA ligase [Sphingomonas zeae]
MTTTRFAPSPTGRLHVGNIRTALHNWIYARKAGGRFLLRIDDTDAERSEERYVEAIRADLDWLGLNPDAEMRQSERFELYQNRFNLLRLSDRIYPAYESAQELDLKRKIQLGRGLPPVYDRAALSLTDADRARFKAEGIQPHWRFKLDHDAPIEWDDAVRGPQRFDPATMSDPVIRRADGTWLYMLPSVIDDIDMGVTQVVRGEDHVSNTALQIQMFQALGAEVPRFAHAALLTGNEGKLSKRLGSLGVDHFREIGIEPQAVRALLARIGTSDPVEPVADMAPLIAGFDFSRFGRAPARFDEAELAQLNARILHQTPYIMVADRLPAGMGEAEWEAVRPNLSTVAEAADWWQVIEGPVDAPEPAEDDRAYLARAAQVAETIDWATDPWHALTAALKDATGRKGKTLFLPLRLALTGRAQGPDMAALLPLIGRDRTVARLNG